jgi:outer membrane receptor protein involved in Fe transport
VRDSNADENYELVFDIYELIANWSTDAFTFTSVTGWLEYSEDRLYDGDLTGIDMFTNDFEEDYEQFSQEIRFASNGGGRFDWILGAFYQTWELEALEATKVDGENFITALGALGFPGFSALANTYAPKIFESSSDTWALFGQFGINFTDSLRLTVGGRYTDEEKDGYRFLDIVNSATGAFDIEQALVGACAFASDYYTLGLVSAVTPLPDCPPPLGTGGFRPVGGYPIHDINGEISESEFTPSLIFEWSFSDASMLYAKYDEGFKAGGFDAKAALIADFEFGPEDVKAYEVGSKNTFANGAAQVNAALFYMDYNDLQTSSFNGRSGFVVSNAAKAEVKGFELDTRWQATERLLAYGSVGYVDFEFKEFTEGACNAWESILTGKLICDRSGQTASGTPEWSAVLGLDYLTALSGTTTLRISGNMSYESSYFTDPSQEVAIKQSAYALFNLRIAMEAEKWTLALMGKNLTDETVIEFGTVVPLSFEAGIYAPAYVVYHKPPRTLAVQFDYRF